MSRKRTNGSEDYQVGYRRPPKHSQFKKGRSGNPRGRPPADQYEWTDMLDKALIEPINVVLADGRKKQMTTLEALIKSTIARALKGDVRHVKLIADGTLNRTIERHKKYVSEADRAVIDAVWEALDSTWATQGSKRQSEDV